MAKETLRARQRYRRNFESSGILVLEDVWSQFANVSNLQDAHQVGSLFTFDDATARVTYTGASPITARASFTCTTGAGTPFTASREAFIGFRKGTSGNPAAGDYQSTADFGGLFVRTIFDLVQNDVIDLMVKWTGTAGFPNIEIVGGQIDIEEL